MSAAPRWLLCHSICRRVLSGIMVILVTYSHLLFLCFCAICWVRLRIIGRCKSSRLPQGPKGLPILGLFGKIPRQNSWYFFTDLAKKYGDVYSFRILGRPVIVLNSFEAINTILSKHSTKYATKPRRRMAELVGLSVTLPFMDPGAQFKISRTHFRHEIGPRGVVRYSIDIECSARILLRNLADDTSCVRLEEILDKSMGTLFLKVSAGYSVPDGGDGRLLSIRQVAVFAANILGGTYSMIDQLPFLAFIPHWMPGSSLTRTAEVWRSRVAHVADMCGQMATEDVASGNPTSVVGAILSNSQEALTPDERQYLELLTLTFSAGGLLPLQSTFLTFFFAMSRYPESQKMAQKELDHVLGGSRLPLLTDRPNLPYIRALVLELLRWVPVAPLVARRVLEDDEYMGYLIPKGTTLLANNWSVTRDPVAYPDPHHFRPERFIKLAGDQLTGATEGDTLNPLAYVFGFGRRSCPGLDFAEMIFFFMNISHLLTVFNITHVGERISGQGYDGTLRLRSGGAACRIEDVDCIITPRSPEALALILNSTEK